MSEISLSIALTERRTVRAFADRAIPAEALIRMVWAAQGVTDGTGKRTAPSANALHPLRVFVAAGRVVGLDPGLYEAGSRADALGSVHLRDLRSKLEAAAIDDQPWIGTAAAVITICADLVAPSKVFADQSPYGARGARYVHIEAGAAAQNVQLQAVAEGLGAVMVGGFHDEATAEVLDLEPPLAPILHLCVGWPDA